MDCQFLQEAERVVHTYEPLVFSGTVEVHHGPRSALGNGLCGIGVAVEILSPKGKEKITFLYGAAVRGHAV